MQGLTANDLLRRIQQNDKDLIVELRTIIERIVRKWNWGQSYDAADIAQDCFVKLMENLKAGKFRQQSSIKTYIYSITRNTCIDYYKASRAAELADIDNVVITDKSANQEEAFISLEERTTAGRVLLALPKECRRLWRAIFFGRRTYKQAAEMLGLTEGTVKRKMWECRQMALEKVKIFEE